MEGARFIAGVQAGQRHYGLDWLRIAAFGVLILYHIGMVFSPWEWVVKASHTLGWLIAPMALLTPWRLGLLFAVSGYASAKLWGKAASPGAFARSRSIRLLPPLAFGMAAIVPVEMWVRALEAGYAGDYLRFWTQDYWHSSFSWEHLWFVAYLWAYTMVLALLLRFGGRRGAAAATALTGWLSSGTRLLWMPIAILALVKLALLFVVAEKQGLTTDWSGHAQYLPLFLFGFALGRTPRLWPPLARCLPLAAATALLSGAAVLIVELRYPGATVPPHLWMALDRAARIAMAWSMTLVLFQLADRWLNQDRRWRATLGEAVFPFYIVHQPAIVLIAWYTLPLHLGALGEFLILLGGTLTACLLFYLVGRELSWLRPLIGLAPRRRPAPVADTLPA